MTELMWGSYDRISDDRREGQGVADQHEDNGTLIGRLGGLWVDRYTDDSRSAYSGRLRPEYERMVADIEAGRINAVAAWHTDRLHRTPRELEDFIDLVERCNVRVETFTTGPVDLSNAEGRMLARIACAIARRESEHKAERVKRRLKSNAEAGKPSGGPRAFGYDDGGLVVNGAEAALVREIARRLLDGGSLAATARWLNGQGMRTTRGNLWRPTTVRQMILSPRLMGVREHKGALYPAQWPAILDEDTFRRLEAHLTDPGRYTPRQFVGPKGPIYLLTGGLLRCERCSAIMLTRTQSQGRNRAYQCGAFEHGRGTGKRCYLSISAAHTERYVASAVLARYGRPETLAALTEAITPEEDAVLAAQIHADAARLEEVENERADGLLDSDSFFRISDRLKRRIAVNRTTLIRSRTLVPPTVDLTDLVGWWNAAPYADRRALLGAVIETVWVAPRRPDGQRHLFDPTRLRIAWRGIAQPVPSPVPTPPRAALPRQA